MLRLILILAMLLPSLEGRTTDSRHIADSTIMVMADGDSVVSYTFSAVKTLEKGAKGPSVKRTDYRAPSSAKKSPQRSISVTSSIDRSRAVGSIPIRSGLTPTGSRTYAIPAETSAYSNCSPEISLCYSSVSGEGDAGYGWNLCGLSSITVRGRNRYYDGEYRVANYRSPDSVYALDGDPLVVNDLCTADTAYRYITAHGKALVRRINNDDGTPKCFKVRFPDGSKATYGDENFYSTTYNYQITEREDALGNKIRYIYEAVEYEGYRDPVRIEYGFRGDETPRAQISFDFVPATDYYPTTFFANQRQMRLSRLSSIESSSNGEQLRKYTLTYDSLGTSFLKRVDCSVGADTLNPIRFSYEYEDEESEDTEEFVSEIVWSPRRYFPTGTDTYYYKRAKIVSDRWGDGIVVYPRRSMYTVTDHSIWGHYQYGSGYATDQDLLIYPLFESPLREDYSVLTSGSGFQTLEPADIDGDGIDELVKINFNGISGNNTKLKITVYRYQESDNTFSSSEYVVNVYGKVEDGRFTSPMQREYFFGDFAGSGHDQLLTISYNKDFTGETRTSKSALIDLSGSSPTVVEKEFQSFDGDGGPYAMAGDLDSDGMAELFLPSRNALKQYRYDSFSGAMVQESSDNDGPALSYFENDGVSVGNVNGDGYQDFLSLHKYTSSPYNTPPSIFEFRGMGPRYLFDSNIVEADVSGDRSYFLDLNKDGFTDMLTVNADSMKFYLNIRGKFRTPAKRSSVRLPSGCDIIPGSFRHMHGNSDLIVIKNDSIRLYEFGSDRTRASLLENMDNGNGLSESTYYADISAKEIYTEPPERTFSAADGFHKTIFPMYVVSEEVSQMNTSQTVSHRTYSYQDAVLSTKGLGFCGFAEVDCIDQNSHIRANTEYDPTMMGVMKRSVTRLSGSPGTIIDSTVFTYAPNVHRYRKMNPLLTWRKVYNKLDGTCEISSFQYDTLGFPTVSYVDCRESELSDSTLYTVSSNTYAHILSGSAYRLGTVSATTEMRVTFPQEEIVASSTSYTCNSAGQPTHVDSYINDELVSTTIMSYDSAGRLTMKKSAPRGSRVYVGDEYGYSSSTGLLDSSWDEYGRWTEYMSCDKYGNPAWIWNENEYWRTDFTYDAWGRKTSTTRHDGTRDSTSVSWSDIALYKVRTKNAGEPETVTHYDALGRVVRQSDRRFDGTWRHVDTQYNSEGQVRRVSLPHKGTPSQWTTYAYDDFGRQTGMNSPGAGVHSWSYSLNAGTGSETDTHVSPEGTVVTTYDFHGRPTQRVNQGDFTTTWLYFDRDLVSLESSTNGTRKSYLYDDDHRLDSVSERGPDGKSLTQFYTYSDDGEGRLESTFLMCDNGDLGTERYYYSGGYNVETSFLPANAAASSDSILVWRLTAENDLGLPTAGQSAGGVGRTYSYDAYGRPTRRTLGAAMDFGYTYDLNDNLASRSDNTRNLTETFTYDTLDRLVSVSGPGSGVGSSSGTRSRVYVPNGNVTSDTKVGTYTYGDPGNPYRQTALDFYREDVPQWDYTLKLNSFSRPDSLRWNQDYYYTTDLAQFDYDASGNLVYSWTGFSGCDYPENEHFYLGGRFETERWLDWSNEDILYLGGDAMTAPVVLKRYWISDEDDPEEAEWTVYNIGRDNLGSITHLVSPAGTKVAETGYDAWGRTRSTTNWNLYEYTDPQTLLYRGYAGYPALQTLGLYHASARIYDPLTGRFLGYDPVVQDPNNSQNWNSYAYCLNNPFRYTDPDGEFWNYIIGGAIGGISNWVANGCEFSWRGLGYFGAGVAIGVLTSGMSAFTASAVNACGVAAGAMIGAATGTLTGAATGFLSNGLNNLVSGNGFMDGAWAATRSGMISGAISGAVSGGIRGYKYAKENGVNPWNNKVESTERQYTADVKNGVSTQPDETKHCYAYVSEYADAGHGNHKSAEFIAANDYKDGGDVRILQKVNPNAKLIVAISNVDHNFYISKFDILGANIQNNIVEAAGTINNGTHWVNIIGISSCDKFSWFGGVTSTHFALKIWNPIGGTVSWIKSSSISDLRVFQY